MLHNASSFFFAVAQIDNMLQDKGQTVRHVRNYESAAAA